MNGWKTLVADWTAIVREYAGDFRRLEKEIENFVDREGGYMEHGGGGLMIGYVWIDDDNCATITDESIHLWKNRQPFAEDPETGEQPDCGDEAISIDEIVN